MGLRCLRDLTRRSARDGNPFFLCVSFTHPHDPFNIHHEYWDLYDGVDIPPPSVPAMPLEEMHPFDQWLQIHHQVDAYPPSDDTIQATRRAYLAMVTYVDAKVGELMGELRRLGIEKDTVVMVNSDHGDMHGEHGMWVEPVSREIFLETWERLETLLLEDCFIAAGANSDEPFVEVFLDQWKGISIHVPLAMRDDVESMLTSFGLEEVIETWEPRPRQRN